MTIVACELEKTTAKAMQPLYILLLREFHALKKINICVSGRGIPVEFFHIRKWACKYHRLSKNIERQGANTVDF